MSPCYQRHEIAPGVHQDIPHEHEGTRMSENMNTPSNPRVGEIQARLNVATPGAQGLFSFHGADVAYLLAELRKRDEALARVLTLCDGADKYGDYHVIQSDTIRAAVADATGGGAS